jgi:myosin heavy subunit
MIYTSIGSILIALNPFKNMGAALYSEDMVMNYYNNDTNVKDMTKQQYTLETAPHV